MKRLFLPVILGASLIAILAFQWSGNQATAPADEKDWNDCVVKFDSEWGAFCEKCKEYKGYKVVYDDTYTVKLRNDCKDRIDLKCCVQEEDKTWRCFNRSGLAPNDSIVAYACKGTGKYLYWARKAGDNEIILPSDKEVNSEYKD